MHEFTDMPHTPDNPTGEQTPTVTLRALSHHTRAVVSPLLTEALQDCGCWTLERSGDACGLYLLFELPLREMAELYPSLMECGLTFDRKGHGELALLCTLGRHALERKGLRRNVTLRLELTFLDELEATVLKVHPVYA